MDEGRLNRRAVGGSGGQIDPGRAVDGDEGYREIVEPFHQGEHRRPEDALGPRCRSSASTPSATVGHGPSCSTTRAPLRARQGGHLPIEG